MLDSLGITIFIATILGFLSGLGIGGGSILILWLTLVLQMDPTTARELNLLFFLPSALIACFFRWRQGKLYWKQTIPAVISGSISALFFSFLAKEINLELFRHLFGGLLIITGLRELFLKRKKPSS